MLENITERFGKERYKLLAYVTLFFMGMGMSLLAIGCGFAFGDGFSNVMYPTNAVLLIALGVSGIGYGKWFKWSFPFQILNLLLTSGLLLLGYVIGY